MPLPLEMIRFESTVDRKEELCRFRKQALRREAFLINHFASYGRAGLNTAFTPGGQATQERRQRRVQQRQQSQRQPNKQEPKGKKEQQPQQARRQWLYSAQKRLIVVQGPGPFRRQREGLWKYLQSKYASEDVAPIIGQWDKHFRLALLDWFTQQVQAEDYDLILVQELTQDLCAVPLPADDQRKEEILGQTGEPARLHPEVLKKRKPEEGVIWMKVEWKRNEMEFLDLSRIMRVREVQILHPEPEIQARIKLSYSLGKPLGLWLSTVQRDSQIEPGPVQELLAPSECGCQHFRTGSELEVNGHVVTTDPGCLRSSQLQRLLLYGRKYRLPQNPEGMRAAIAEALEAHVARYANAMTVESFDAWKDEILKRVDMRLVQQREQGFEPEFILDDEARKELGFLRQQMTVTFADKSTHDFVLICKAVYQDALRKELMQNSIYQPLTTPLEILLQEHAKLAEKCGQKPVENLAHLYGVAKLHKQPVGFRWIAGAAKVNVGRTSISTTSIGQVAAVLGGLLRRVMMVLQAKDTRLIKQTGVRRYWIIRSAEEAAERLKAVNPELAGRLWTRDFSTMYTSLPQERLQKQVMEAVHEAYVDQAAYMQQPVEKTGMAIRFDQQRKV